MASNLTPEALTGYHTGPQDAPNPHIYSSACWFAFEAGRALHRTGRCAPVKATMGRGYTVNVWTVATQFKAWFDKNNACVLDRVNH